MKITGTILTQKTMAEMKVGESGFLAHSAITLINRKYITINPNHIVAPYKTQECVIPIMRIGPESGDYEINMFISQVFFNFIFSEEDIETYKNNNKDIGPYPIEVEVFDSTSDVDQIHPRMTWNELLEEFVAINAPLVRDELTEDELNLLTNEKQTTIKYMTEQIDKMSLETLECFQNTFKPMSDQNDPEAYNPYEDEELDMLIIKRVKLLKKRQTYEDMSLEELEIKKQQYILQDRFEEVDKIQPYIDKKKIKQTK